jgi:hypothetical protein
MNRSTETTAACTDVWNAIYQYAVPGSVVVALWRDQARERWFER